MTLAAGVDIGSTTAKCALLEDGRVVGKSLNPVGVELVKDAERALELALEDAGRPRREIAVVTGTGYGRFKVTFGQFTVTEIGCHAKGAHHLFPATRVVLDIGGQDTKAIKVDARGEVVDFAMNDKCAAGTGRFLDVCAGALGYDVSEIGPLSFGSRHPVRVTNTCTVFAESEVSSYVARGKDTRDIVAGLYGGIVSRSLSLLQRVGVEPEVTFTGGVSRNEGMVRTLEQRMNLRVNVSPLSQFMGAIGAALYGLDRIGGTPA
ncbi:MAG: acyl-CoA dehydratase activase [Thermoplasmata archaeon]